MPEEFDGKPLDALHAMIAFARPGELTARGEALAKAVPELQKIAKDLRHYIGRVQWDGAAGDAFRLWGADMVAQTLRLADYTNTASTELTRAAQALTEAKSALPKPTGTCFTDPTKEAARVAEETGPKLQEAIHQMERLASYYGVAKERLDAAKEPRFLPIGDSRSAEMERPYGPLGGGGDVSPALQPVPAADFPSHDSALPWGPMGNSSEPAPPEVRTRTNSVSPVAPGHLESPMPESSLPRQAPNGQGWASPAQQMPSLGTSAAALRSASGNGVVGSSPTLSTAGAQLRGPRVPLGSVIGPDAGALGRGAVALPGSTGSVTTRSSPGRGDAPAPPLRSSQNPAGTGFFPPMATAPSSPGNRSSGSRPAYLSEDEETWTLSQRNVVPPVID